MEAVDLNHYYMQSKSNYAWHNGQWNEFTPWLTSDVIDPLHISATNLAVLASYHRAGAETVYIPADVLVTGHAAPTSQKYTLVFQTARNIQTLRVTIMSDAGQRTELPKLECNRQINPNCQLYPAGTTQAVDLPMVGLGPGNYHVVLDATVPRSVDRLSLEVRIYQPSPEPAK